MTDSVKIYLTRGKEGCALAERLGAIAIVVDALRASATLAALLEHGISRILVIASVEDARAHAACEPDALLVGERGGERLDGFHLGNSPLEIIAAPDFAARTAIFTSSNGAQRLAACLHAHRTLVGSVSNAGAVVEWTRRTAVADQRPVVLIAAGQYPDENFISPEDESTCAYLAARLGLPIAADAQAAFAHLEREFILHGLADIFHHSAHAQRLMKIGYSEDVLFCARADTLRTLPVVSGPVMLGDRLIGVEVREQDQRQPCTQY